MQMEIEESKTFLNDEVIDSEDEQEKVDEDQEKSTSKIILTGAISSN